MIKFIHHCPHSPLHYHHHHGSSVRFITTFITTFSSLVFWLILYPPGDPWAWWIPGWVGWRWFSGAFTHRSASGTNWRTEETGSGWGCLLIVKTLFCRIFSWVDIYLLSGLYSAYVRMSPMLYPCQNIYLTAKYFCFLSLLIPLSYLSLIFFCFILYMPFQGIN